MTAFITQTATASTFVSVSNVPTSVDMAKMTPFIVIPDWRVSGLGAYHEAIAKVNQWLSR